MKKMVLNYIRIIRWDHFTNPPLSDIILSNTIVSHLISHSGIVLISWDLATSIQVFGGRSQCERVTASGESHLTLWVFVSPKNTVHLTYNYYTR